MLTVTKLAINKMRSGCSRAQKVGTIYAGSAKGIDRNVSRAVKADGSLLFKASYFM